MTFYGIILLACGFSYYVLTIALLKQHSENSTIYRAIGSKMKEKMSIGLYVGGIILSFWFPLIAFLIYIVVALMWLVPDNRIAQIENATHG